MDNTTRVRISALFLAVLVSGFLIRAVQSAWTRYWITTDGRQGVAHVTAVGRHVSFEYAYTVDGKTYSEEGALDWPAPQPGVGREVPLFYSASRPWLASLHKPKEIIRNPLPELVIFAIEAWLITTAINPRWKYALNFARQDGRPKPPAPPKMLR